MYLFICLIMLYMVERLRLVFLLIFFVVKKGLNILLRIFFLMFVLVFFILIKMYLLGVISVFVFVFLVLDFLNMEDWIVSLLFLGMVLCVLIVRLIIVVLNCDWFIFIDLRLWLRFILSFIFLFNSCCNRFDRLDKRFVGWMIFGVSVCWWEKVKSCWIKLVVWLVFWWIWLIFENDGFFMLWCVRSKL